MQLSRKQAASKFYGKHKIVNENNTDDIINYLNELDIFLSSFDYESNQCFVFCGSKKMLLEEMQDILNGKRNVTNPFYSVLRYLEEFISNNNSVFMDDSKSLNMDFDDLKNANNKYISTGIICLEEVEIIRKFIAEVKKYLDEAQAENEKLPTLPEPLKDFVYDYNGKVYPKQKLPKELEKEYKDYLKKVDKNNDIVNIELNNIIENDDYRDIINKEDAKIASILHNKSTFYMLISSGNDVPIWNQEYYINRAVIILEKNLLNNQVSRKRVEIENKKYNVDNLLVDKVIDYIKANFNKLIKIASNQNVTTTDGDSDYINIKIGPIYLTLSIMSARFDEDKLFLKELKNKIVEILTSENGIIEKESKKVYIV